MFIDVMLLICCFFFFKQKTAFEIVLGDWISDVGSSDLVVFGASLLLRTTGYVEGTFSLWPILLVLLGMFLLYRVFFKSGREGNVFAGIFLILAGAFLVILNTGVFDRDFKHFWPLFMLFAGVSLFFYGLKKRGAAKIRMMIPAFSIILLSLVFLLFSLNLVSVSFRQFVVMWWPAILVFAGAVLIVADFLGGRKIRRRN